jgi:putative transposase
MKRAYKFLLRPTSRQARALSEMVCDHRVLYNAALQERRDAYRHTSATSIRYCDQSAQLRDIRTGDPGGQGRWSFSSQQATLRRLNTAFAAFFRRVKAGQTPGYPRFKGAGRFEAVEFPKDGDGCRWDSTPADTQTRVRLQGIGHVKVHQHRPVQGTVKTVSVKREGTRWFVVLSCDDVPAELLPGTGRNAGIDMGVAHFATTSDGEHLPNPRHGRAAADELAAAQQHLATFPRRKRARDRTKAHRAAAPRVRKLHRKVARQRRDHHHKTALALVRRYDTIAVEDLNIAGMTRTPVPKPDGTGGYLPNGANAKAGLHNSILDAGWGAFLTILDGKAEKAGRRVIRVDACNTSRTCPDPDCGYVAAGNRVTQADFSCGRCGYTGNADVVGATNVANRAGLVRYDAV